jgi:diguanylate cyclase (GGDEF)-like protein
VGLLYPQIQRYIDNTDNLKAQPLTAAVRDYLIDSLSLVSQENLTDAQRHQILLDLDISYGLLNINFFITRYPCINASFSNIDRLAQQIKQEPTPNLARFSNTLLPIMKCVDAIQSDQDNIRAKLANKMVENFTQQRNLLIFGAIIAFVAGIGFLVLHIKQSKLMALTRDETHKWIANAKHDALTGALNRRAFDLDLPHYVERYNQSGNLFSLLMCDIDYFKQYNDTFGHCEGDKALQLVMNALSLVLRERDNLYRYGGEEMVVILDNTDPTQAKQIGQRILEEVQQLKLRHPTSEHQLLTISIGCATVSEKLCIGTDIMKRADARLYTAKRAGRNCMVGAQDKTGGESSRGDPISQKPSVATKEQ